jgi:hypothetical protein
MFPSTSRPLEDYCSPNAIVMLSGNFRFQPGLEDGLS